MKKEKGKDKRENQFAYEKTSPVNGRHLLINLTEKRGQTEYITIMEG